MPKATHAAKEIKITMQCNYTSSSEFEDSKINLTYNISSTTIYYYTKPVNPGEHGNVFICFQWPVKSDLDRFSQTYQVTRFYAMRMAFQRLKFQVNWRGELHKQVLELATVLLPHSRTYSDPLHVITTLFCERGEVAHSILEMSIACFLSPYIVVGACAYLLFGPVSLKNGITAWCKRGI